MVNCKLVTEDQRTPLIGAYLTPSTLDYQTNFEEAMNRVMGRETMILGDLNTDIVRMRNTKDQQVTYFLAPLRLVDILAHFLQSLCYHNLQT